MGVSPMFYSALKKDMGEMAMPPYLPAFSTKTDAEAAQRNGEVAANIVTTLLLRSSPEMGIDPQEVEPRRNFFGSNAEKSVCEGCGSEAGQKYLPRSLLNVTLSPAWMVRMRG